MPINSPLSAKPPEVLLVSCASSDPFSTNVVDCRTGVSTWSYKGSELQGITSGIVYPLGTFGEHFLVAGHDRPLLHCLAFHARDRFHAKAVVAGVVRSVVSTRDATLLFVAVHSQVFVWLLHTGELLSVLDAHYQTVTEIALSSDDAMLFTASQDGSVHAYLVADIVNVDRDVSIVPLCKWRAHSLAVRSIAVSKGGSPRVVSVGLDHTAAIHCVSLDACLLKVSADRPLTACVMDPAETRVFVATDLGNIAQINLYDVGNRQEMLIQTADERNLKVPVFNGHSDEILRLAINGDGTLLASGDSTGKYCIWDIQSRQCLKVASMRGPIVTLNFIPNWPSLHAPEFAAPSTRPCLTLQRNPVPSKNIVITRRTVANEDTWSETADRMINRLIKDIKSGSAAQAQPQERKKKKKIRTVSHEDGDSDDEICILEPPAATPVNAQANPTTQNNSDEVQRLRKEVAKLKKINAQLYEYASKELLGKD